VIIGAIALFGQGLVTQINNLTQSLFGG